MWALRHWPWHFTSEAECVECTNGLLAYLSFFTQIKAVDNGRPQKRQSARVIFTIVACPNTSVASPAFHQEGVSAQVMESDSVGHMVAIMSAEDRDSTKLWYSITGEFHALLWSNTQLPG